MPSISEPVELPTDPGSRRYRRADCVVFQRTREAFGGLSNMATGYPLRVSGVGILTSEALYQACRFPHMPEVQGIIIRQRSPMTAKMKSKPHRSQSREDWDSVRVAIMKWCLKVKLVQHWTAFGNLLLSTSDRPIVEQSRTDRFWGAVAEPNGDILDGANVLGRLLMDIRARLKKDPSQFEIVSPVPISDFSLLGRPIEPVRRGGVLEDGAYQDVDGEEELEQHVLLHLR
jgi:ribA/ribD-fused uncharacterized protein